MTSIYYLLLNKRRFENFSSYVYIVFNNEVGGLKKEEDLNDKIKI